MPSQRSLERRLESLGGTPDFDGPEEIVITDTVVYSDGDAVEEEQTRVWRDDRGEWHSEQVFDRSEKRREDNDFTTLS